MSDHHDEADGHEGHAHASSSTPTRKLAIALGLTATFMFVEVAAGWLTGSLALLSDAGHMLTDAGALTVALLAQRVAQRARTGQRTFGYRRAEVLAALANGVVLGVSSIWIVIEAIRRLWEPPHVQGLPMLTPTSLFSWRAWLRTGSKLAVTKRLAEPSAALQTQPP